jgi:hypothetical protein
MLRRPLAPRPAAMPRLQQAPATSSWLMRQARAEQIQPIGLPVCRSKRTGPALDRGMTVAQLIEALQDMPEDAVVVFDSDYGDICHTEQALLVSRVEELDNETERLETSAYSHSGIAVKPIVDATEADGAEASVAEDANHVVILRS